MANLKQLAGEILANGTGLGDHSIDKNKRSIIGNKTMCVCIGVTIYCRGTTQFS